MHGGVTSDVIDIVFSVVAETNPGSEIRVVGSADALGRWHPEGGVTLRTEPGLYPRWSVAVRLQTGCVGTEYKFVKVLEDGSVEWEDGPDRRLPPGAVGPAAACTPRFGQYGVPPRTQSAAPSDGGWLTLPSPQAWSPAIPKRGSRDAAPVDRGPICDRPSSTIPAPDSHIVDNSVEVKFEATCTCTAPGDVLRVVGSADAIGSWKPPGGLELKTSATSFPRWSACTRMPLGGLPVEWKLVISRSDGTEDWETGPNRRTRLVADKDVTAWLIQVLFEGSCCAPEPCRPSGLGCAARPMPGAGTTSVQVNEADTTPRGAACKVSASRPISLQVATPLVSEEMHEHKSRRSSSLSYFPEPLVLGSKEVEGSISSLVSRRRAAPETRSKKDLDSAALPEHLLVFRLCGDSSSEAAAAAAAVVVEASFHGAAGGGCSGGAAAAAAAAAARDAVVHRLQLDRVEAGEVRWVLNVAELGLSAGLHLFHFVVDGEDMLSCDHTIVGDCNAILISESIRRYILVREALGQSQPPHALPGHASACTSTMAWSPSPSGLPQMAHEDTEANVQERAGAMARPWSCAFNLAAMAEDEDDMPGASHNAIANFSKDIFDGLYDAELRLRIDSHILPQTTSLAASSQRHLRLWAGGHLLKKKVGACEDAYFTDDCALGVADGVGCMVQFASYGINAAAYAAELMEHSQSSLQPGGMAAQGVAESVDVRAASALAAAECAAESYGASTITLLVLEGNSVGVANLGDSGFMLLRKAQRGMTVVRRSEEQQHSWNCPYQLTRLPAALVSRFPKVSLDTAEDCERYCFEVQEGDLLLLFTDGMRDNLHEREVLHIVDCALSPALGQLVGLAEHATPPESVARALALAAQERSLDPVAKVPFVEYSKRHGYQCMGGKQDDITVVAAWVMPEHRPIGSCPQPKAAELETPAPIETVSLGGGAARLHKGHGGSAKLKYEMPRRSGGYEQASHAIIATTATSGVSTGRPPQCRAEFRPMSSSKMLGVAKNRTSSGAARRLDT